MQTNTTCGRCGSSNLNAGELTFQGRKDFRLFSPPQLRIFTPDVKVEAMMCLDCGNIDFTGDVMSARQILNK